VPPTEFQQQSQLAGRLTEIGREYLDIDRITDIAGAAAPVEVSLPEPEPALPKTVRIGYFSDPVFTFYYPENLEALEEA
jgi:cobyrinic acid a,c-diamide synthase